MENRKIPTWKRPKSIEPCDDKQIDVKTNCEHLFKSHDEMKKSLTRLCYGNLYVLGRVWIEAMKTVLVGAKPSLIPAVKAAPPEKPPPTKPPKMKLKDLSIYKSPHAEYHDYLYDKTRNRCQDQKEKIVYNKLLPCVKQNRKHMQELLKDYKKDIECQYKEICATICHYNKKFTDYMRHDDNEILRKAVVINSTILGFVVGRRLGRWKDSLLKGLVLSSICLLASGALCFPKETDENFRSFCYETATIGIKVFNLWCGKNASLKDPALCDKDKPAELKEKRKDQCAGAAGGKK